MSDPEAISLNRIKLRDCYAPLAITVSLKIWRFRSGTNYLKLIGFRIQFLVQSLAIMVLGILMNAYFRKFLRLVLLLVSFVRAEVVISAFVQINFFALW